MSTRSQVHFVHNGVTFANVYVHHDGYPEHRIPEIREFFNELLNYVPDTRFGDPEYLAAKYVVYKAVLDTMDPSSHALDFLGVGVAREDHGDIEFIYCILCDDKDEKGRPVVRFKNVGADTWTEVNLDDW